MADTNVQIKLSADGSQVRNEIKLIDQQLQQLGNNVGVPQLNLGAGVTPISQQQNLQQQQGNTPQQRQRDRTFARIYREMLTYRRELQTLNRNLPGIINSLQHLNLNLSQQHQTQQSLPPPQGLPNTTSPLPTSQTTPVTINSPSVIVNNTGNSQQNQSTSQSSKDKKDKDKDSPNMIGNMKRMLATLGVIAFLKHAADMDYQRQKSAHQTYGSLLTDSDYSGAARRATDWGKNLGYDYNEVLPTIRANQQAAGFAGLGAQQRDITAILGAARAYNIDSATLARASGRMTATGTFRVGEQQKFANMLAKSIKENDMRGRENEQLSVLESINANLATRNTTVTAETMASGMNLYNAIAHLNPNMRGERGGNLANRMIDIANSRDTGLDILAGLGTTYTGITGELELMRLSENDPQQYYKRVWDSLVASYGDNPGDEFSATNQLMYKLTKGQGMSFNQAQLAVEAIKSGGTFDTKALSAEGQAEGEDEITKRLDSYKASTLATLDQFEIKWNELMARIGEKVNDVKASFIEWFGDIDEWVNKAENMFGNIKDTISEYLPSFESIKEVIDEYLPSFEDIKETLDEAGKSIKETTEEVKKLVEEIREEVEEFRNSDSIIDWIKKKTGDSEELKAIKDETYERAKKGEYNKYHSSTTNSDEYSKPIESGSDPLGLREKTKWLLDTISDAISPSRASAAELPEQYRENYDPLKTRKPRNIYDESPSFRAQQGLTTTEYRDNQVITQKLAKDTQRGLAENTEALIENTKRLGVGGTGTGKSDDERYLLLQKENAIRREQEGWKNLFAAQGDKDKAITDALKMIVGSLSNRGGSNTPTTPTTPTVPGKNDPTPVIPTDLQHLGTVEYNGKTYNLDALRDDIEKNNIGTSHLPAGKLAFFQTLLLKKLTGGKTEIAPGALYGQTEIESGGGLHSSDEDTKWWYLNNRNPDGRHAPKGTDESKLAHERNGKLNIGATTGLPFYKYDSWTESYRHKLVNYLARYGLGKVTTGSQYASLIPNYLTGHSDPNDPRVIKYGREIDSYQREFDKYFNGADRDEFDKYTVGNSPVSVDTNQVTINADKVEIPKEKPDRVEEVQRQVQYGADPRGTGAITADDIKNRKSHGHGLKNVPYDLYPAQLHKGERVLTKLESEQLRDIKGVSIPDQFKIDEEIDSLPEIKKKRELQERYKDATSYTGSNLSSLFGSDYLQGLQDDLLKQIKQFDKNQYFNAPQFAVGTPDFQPAAGKGFDVYNGNNSAGLEYMTATKESWEKLGKPLGNYESYRKFLQRQADDMELQQHKVSYFKGNGDSSAILYRNNSKGERVPIRYNFATREMEEVGQDELKTIQDTYKKEYEERKKKQQPIQPPQPPPVEKPKVQPPIEKDTTPPPVTQPPPQPKTIKYNDAEEKRRQMVEWARAKAADQRVGYTQRESDSYIDPAADKRYTGTRNGEFGYDCSSFVYSAAQHAGFDVIGNWKKNPEYQKRYQGRQAIGDADTFGDDIKGTGNWQRLKYEKGMKLESGDIMGSDSHMGIYDKNGQVIQARGVNNPRGGDYAPGDQGGEVDSYSVDDHKWKYVYRYMGKDVEKQVSGDTPTQQPTENPKLKQTTKLKDSRGSDNQGNDLGSPRQWDYQTYEKPPSPTAENIRKGSLQPTELDPFKNPRGRRDPQKPIQGKPQPNRQPVQGKPQQNAQPQIPKSPFSQEFMERINTDLTEENYKTHFKNTDSLDDAKKQQEHLKNYYEKHKDDYNIPIQQDTTNQLEQTPPVQKDGEGNNNPLEGKINDRILNPPGTVNIPDKNKKSGGGGILDSIFKSATRPEFISKLPFMKKLPFPAEKLMTITQMPIIKDIFGKLTGASGKSKDGKDKPKEEKEHHGIINRWLGKVKPKDKDKQEGDKKKLTENGDTPENKVEGDTENQEIPKDGEKPNEVPKDGGETPQDNPIDKDGKDKPKDKKKGGGFNLESIGKTLGSVGAGAQLLGALTKNDKIGKIGGILSIASAGAGLLGGLFKKSKKDKPKDKKEGDVPKDEQNKEIPKDGEKPNEVPKDGENPEEKDTPTENGDESKDKVKPKEEKEHHGIINRWLGKVKPKDKKGEGSDVPKDEKDKGESDVPKDNEKSKDPKDAEHIEFHGKVTTPGKDKPKDKKKGGGILGGLFGGGDLSSGMSTVGGILGTLGKATGNDMFSSMGTNLGKLGAAGQIFGGLFGGQENKPNTKGVDNRPTFKDIVGGIFGGGDSKKNPMEKPDLLGGLFGKQSEGANILQQGGQSTSGTRETTENSEDKGTPGGGNSGGIPSKIEIVVNVKGTENWSPKTQSKFVETLSKTFEHMLPNTNR